MHCFLGHEGIAPLKFLAASREQLRQYETVSLVSMTVINVEREGGGFYVVCEDGSKLMAKAVLLATGLIDKLPEVDGAEDCYGLSLHHCPYCDGWEHRGQRIGVIGSDKHAIELAIELRQWSEAVCLYAHSQEPVVPEATSRLHGSGIRIVPGTVRALEHSGGHLQQLRMSDGSCDECDALFFSPYQCQHSPLAQKLGCSLEGCEIECDAEGGTGIEGLFVAGNVSKGVQLAIVAAAEGVKAAAAINEWLSER
jgi:thioredoxin reductase